MEVLSKEEFETSYIEWEFGLAPGTVYHIVHVVGAPADETRPLIRGVPKPEWAKNLWWLLSCPPQLNMYIAPDDNAEEKANYFRSQNMRVGIERKIALPDTRIPEEKYYVKSKGLEEIMARVIAGGGECVARPVSVKFPIEVKYFHLSMWGDALYDFKNVKSLVWENITIDPKIFTEKEPLYSMLSNYQSFKVIVEDISKPVEFSCMLYGLEKYKDLKSKNELVSNGFLYRGGCISPLPISCK